MLQENKWYKNRINWELLWRLNNPGYLFFTSFLLNDFLLFLLLYSIGILKTITSQRLEASHYLVT